MSECRRAGLIITREQWFALPPKLRQRWWAETDYGKNEPSPAMMKEMRETITTRKAT